MQLTEQDGRLLHDRYQQTGRVAAHYTPLIGPYDSRDTQTIDLHMDLIALSGIDGILFKYACAGLQPNQPNSHTFRCKEPARSNLAVGTAFPTMPTTHSCSKRPICWLRAPRPRACAGRCAPKIGPSMRR